MFLDQRYVTTMGWIALAITGACAPATDQGAIPVSTVDELDRTPPAEGWRWESSLGVQVGVPADWKVNDTDCNQTAAPSVVRAQGATLDCLTLEPKGKQIVEIGGDNWEADPPEGIELKDVTVDGVSGRRGEGTLEDGRAIGWQHLPSKHVIVQARVLTEETLLTALDSVRVVDVDHNGCATAREAMKGSAPAEDTLVPSDARAISVCYFGHEDVLQTSALIDGDDARAIVQQLNLAQPGRNADVPETECLRDGEEPPDVMLVAYAKSAPALVEIGFSGCTQRGMWNGRQHAKLTISTLEKIMKPLHTGYGFSNGLPKN